MSETSNSRRDMPYSAVFVLELQDEACARGIYKAILPESLRPTTRRSRLQLKQSGRTLSVRVEAEDIVALRASSNSNLRWVSTLKNSYQALFGEKGYT